jgi:cyanophycin synthetase
VRAAVLGCNNEQAIRFASDKHLTHLLMDSHGIDMPAFRHFTAFGNRAWNQAALDAGDWARTRYPVVVKAVTGSGAKNVHANIENDEEFHWALSAIRVANVHAFLVEEHLVGNLYRVKVFDGDVIQVFTKLPGTVVGDGRSTIRELVHILDAERAACGQRPIPLRGQVRRHLRKSGLQPDSVLPHGVVQTLTTEVSGRLGCRRESVPTNALPARAADLFRRAAVASGLRLVGFDYFCDEITDAASAHCGTFDELNSAPSPTEFVPGMSEADYLRPATEILRRYFDIPRAGVSVA